MNQITPHVQKVLNLRSTMTLITATPRRVNKRTANCVTLPPLVLSWILICSWRQYRCIWVIRTYLNCEIVLPWINWYNIFVYFSSVYWNWVILSRKGHQPKHVFLGICTKFPKVNTKVYACFLVDIKIMAYEYIIKLFKRNWVCTGRNWEIGSLSF